jgi:hypothetical protein
MSTLMLPCILWRWIPQRWFDADKKNQNLLGPAVSAALGSPASIPCCPRPEEGVDARYAPACDPR